MKLIPIDAEIKEECLFTLEEFIEMCNFGTVSNDDGTGYYSSQSFYDRDRQVFPDEIRKSNVLLRRDDYSHVVWFNK